MKLFLLLIFTLPLVIRAQTDLNKIENESIIFESELTWDQIKHKAKVEKKYIFVDCYATWCGPCKQMDNMVYPVKEVGEQLNKNFISFKLQIDTGKNDKESIRKRYKLANKIKNEYKITTLPTYLFFDPAGNIVHRDMGFKNISKFRALLSDVLDKNMQVYTLLKKYRQKKLSYKLMPELATKTKVLLQNGRLADTIATVYYNNYLSHLSEDELLKKENIIFLSSFSVFSNSTNKYFKVFYKEGKKVDSIMGDRGFSKRYINNIIMKEEIFGNIKPNGVWNLTPKWDLLYSNIKNKFGDDYAQETIIDAKIAWYNYKKEQDSVIIYQVEKIDIYGVDTSFWGRFRTNNIIYDLIFKGSNDKTILKKAARWMEIIIEADSNDGEAIDTYANLLYKMGNIKEAIIWQEKAVKISPYNDEIKTNLSKMKLNEPTWN